MQIADKGIRIVLKLPMQTDKESASCSAIALSHFVPMKLRRRGVEMRVIIDGQSDSGRADPALLKAIAPARCWFEEVASGQARSLVEIARREGLPKRYLTRLALLAFVSPTIVEGVADGCAPAEFNLQMLMDGRLALPLDWKDAYQGVR